MSLLELKKELSTPGFGVSSVPDLPRRKGTSNSIKNAALTNSAHEALTQASAILNCPINQFLEVGGLFFLENLVKSNQLDQFEKRHLQIILDKWKADLSTNGFVQRTSKKRKSLL